MATKLKAPSEDTVSTTVPDGTNYEVVDGHITVENGDHIPFLTAAGYTASGARVAPNPEASTAEKGGQGGPTPETPEPELPFTVPALPETDPDFDRMNRTQLVEFLETYGVAGRKASEDKQVLVTAATTRLAQLREDAKSAQESKDEQ